VTIALAKVVLDKLFKTKETDLLEIVIYAGLFAAAHYQGSPPFIARQFVFGLLFSYLYLRTGSLAYGIILNSLMVIFF
jgi:membrane protease YdiL (CAAX protease family)